ncbi:hypothetical protein D3C85_1678260 [compost metagenome]
MGLGELAVGKGHQAPHRFLDRGRVPGRVAHGVHRLEQQWSAPHREEAVGDVADGVDHALEGTFELRQVLAFEGKNAWWHGKAPLTS